MQPASIVDVFEEGADMGSGLVDPRISFAVHFFLLERSHEALGFGVVIGVAGAAHADQDGLVERSMQMSMIAKIEARRAWGSRRPLSLASED